MNKSLSKKNFWILIATMVSVVVLVLALCLTLIKTPVFKDGPNKNDAVVGNGTMAVAKGDYLYFTNGFVSASENYQKNKGNKIYKSAIYRVKAEGASNSAINGVLSFNYGALEFDEEKCALVGAERLTSKIAGFEDAKLFIFDNVLYFTSPSTNKDLQTGVTQTSYVDIYKINLDGTGLKCIFTIKNYSNGQANFYRNGQDIYGVFYDGADVLTIVKNNKEVLQKSGVSSLVMPTFSSDYNGLDTTDEQTIVYLTSGKIGKISLPNKTNASLQDNDYSIQSKSIGLLAIKNNVLIYTKKGSVNTSSYYLDLKEENTLVSDVDLATNARRLTTMSLTSSLVLRANSGDIAIVGTFTDSNKTYATIFASDNTKTQFEVESGAILLFNFDDKIVYRTSSDLYIFDISVENSPSTKITNSKIKFTNDGVSFDGTYVYYYAEKTNEAGTSYYLERVCLRTTEDYVTEEISVRLSQDLPDPEETEEE